jgi:hypothetical protein
MTTDKILDVIKDKLFYGSADYTKSQPDLFIPHKFQLIAPSEAGRFLEDVRQSLTEEEILIYVHLPFCFSECLFCNSFPHKMDNALQQDYLQSLLREIDLCSDAGLFAGKKARCLSLGGGTPTSFSNDDIHRILKKIQSCIPLSEKCSITCEAHPGTLTGRSRLQELAEIGITGSKKCRSSPSVCGRDLTQEQFVLTSMRTSPPTFFRSKRESPPPSAVSL